MSNLLARTIIATLLLAAAPVPAQQSPTQAPQDLPSILERCWRAAEIKSNRSTNFDQDAGHFRGEVRLRWCQTSLVAFGPVERRGSRGSRSRFVRIDSLTLHLRTDTITAQLRERAGDAPRLIVNGHAVAADWWLAGSRERVLRLARVPLSTSEKNSVR
ncbi:MAG: hypothetical protein ABR585_11955 [Gemmatimonadaceae bacterium]